MSNCPGNRPAPLVIDDAELPSPPETDDTVECSKTKLCADGLCCSKWGFCGLGPQFCGKGCKSQCTGAQKEYEPQCSATKECEDGSCCSKWGFCGTTEKFCGRDCISNCVNNQITNDGELVTSPPQSGVPNPPLHVTECGRFAEPNNRYCPLNICCSQYGYCGTSTEFCKTGCQSNCDKPPRANCVNSPYSSIKRTVGYYAGWAVDPEARLCGRMTPEQIDPYAFTHLVFSFASIENNRILISDANLAVAKRLVDLKNKNPNLKVLIAVGGYPSHEVFSTLASNPEARISFVQSAVDFLAAHGFDGLDIDWEYPAQVHSGGRTEDLDNYVLLLRDLRLYFGNQFLLSIAAPSSYWYLKHYDLLRISQTVDWINVMTYDMHGVWDAPRSPFVYSHTNLTDIENAIDIYLRAGVLPDKINLGLAFYGRTYELADPNCTLPGCKFLGAGREGRCTNAPGILSYYEIARLLIPRHRDSWPLIDTLAGAKVIAYDSRQWLGYDDAQTFRMKMDYAKSNCLGGIMAWSVDLDDDHLSLQTEIKTSAFIPPSSRPNPVNIHRRPQHGRFSRPGNQ